MRVRFSRDSHTYSLGFSHDSPTYSLGLSRDSPTYSFRLSRDSWLHLPPVSQQNDQEPQYKVPNVADNVVEGNDGVGRIS